MKVSPLHLCNNFLYRGFKENIEITPMKLQKLLYFLCRNLLKKLKEPFISEKFQVWQYGPVLESVYAEFKSFHSKPITHYAKDARGKSFMLNEKDYPELERQLNYVWSMYKGYSGIELSKITHKAGSAWYKAYQENRTEIEVEDMLYDDIG